MSLFLELVIAYMKLLTFSLFSFHLAQCDEKAHPGMAHNDVKIEPFTHQATCSLITHNATLISLSLLSRHRRLMSVHSAGFPRGRDALYMDYVMLARPGLTTSQSAWEGK